MGLADMMMLCRIPYGTETKNIASGIGCEFASKIMEFIRFHSMNTSVRLARERGSFNAIKGSIFDPSAQKVWEIPTPLIEYKHNFNRPEIDWEALKKDIFQWGIRNSEQTTIAPTGTISTVSGVDGYGCEPVFSLGYIRNMDVNGENKQLSYLNSILEEYLRSLNLEKETEQEIIDKIAYNGSIKEIDQIDDDIKNVFLTSNEISVESHVRMQACLQRFVGNSISKTINLPFTATIEDILETYFKAWELGLKGITVYRNGSRTFEVLETRQTKETKNNKENQKFIVEARHSMRDGKQVTQITPCGNLDISLNYNTDDPQKYIREVFISQSKSGSDLNTFTEAIGRLISILLRSHPPEQSEDILKEVISQFKNIGSVNGMRVKSQRIESVPHAIAIAIAKRLKFDSKQIQLSDSISKFIEDSNDQFDICPECGNHSAIRREGCLTCQDCLYSKCF